MSCLEGLHLPLPALSCFHIHWVHMRARMHAATRAWPVLHLLPLIACVSPLRGSMHHKNALTAPAQAAGANCEVGSSARGLPGPGHPPALPAGSLHHTPLRCPACFAARRLGTRNMYAPLFVPAIRRTLEQHRQQGVVVHFPPCTTMGVVHRPEHWALLAILPVSGMYACNAIMHCTLLNCTEHASSFL